MDYSLYRVWEKGPFAYKVRAMVMSCQLYPNLASVPGTQDNITTLGSTIDIFNCIANCSAEHEHRPLCLPTCRLVVVLVVRTKSSLDFDARSLHVLLHFCIGRACFNATVYATRSNIYNATVSFSRHLVEHAPVLP